MTEEYEYVKVTGSIFDLKDDFEAGNLYYHYQGSGVGTFIRCHSENNLFMGMKSNCLYKRIKKERKFNDGEWYPCIDDGDENSIYMYSNGMFFLYEHNSVRTDIGALVSSMKWIGESLGKIKFGE